VYSSGDGGWVGWVRGRQGQQVAVGQPLIEIDPETLQSEVDKRRSEWEGLALAAARLAAEAAGHAPSFPAGLSSARPDLAIAQTSLYEARTIAFRAERRSLDDVIQQREREVEAAQSRAHQAAASLEILKKQESAVAKLADKGYYPHLRYLSLQREVAEAEGALPEARESRSIADAALAEATSRREALERDNQAKILAELPQTTAARYPAVKPLAQAEAELHNRVIMAPAEGIVQDLAVAAPGQSVQ